MSEAIFIGVDLGWYGKPSGLAVLHETAVGLVVEAMERLEDRRAILSWIETHSCAETAVVAVDAPTVIRNAAGIRLAERELNRDFRRFHAGCHAANLGRPFAQNVLQFSGELEKLGFQQGPAMTARQRGRFQIEVHPHAAAVNLFDLPRIVKYKRGRRAERANELRRLRQLMLDVLPTLDPPLRLQLPEIPESGPLKPVEDRIDAVLCAYIAAGWWMWAKERNCVYGDGETGHIVVPHRVPRSYEFAK